MIKHKNKSTNQTTLPSKERSDDNLAGQDPRINLPPKRTLVVSSAIDISIVFL